VSGDRAGPSQFWGNLRASREGTVQTAFTLARNLARRLRGSSCCGHPGQPGC
jgi:hypothetical protein